MMQAPVIVVQQRSRRVADAVDELWRRVADAGWLPSPDVPVTMHVVGDGAPDLARLTAAAFPAPGVVRDDAAHAPGPTSAVAGIGASRVVVPRCWFDAGALVTIAAVHGDPAARMAGILAAQARVLEPLCPHLRRLERVYEAHRLGRSDVAVACGRTAGDAWWIASPSDVAVDVTLASAAALGVADLPDLRAIARHELLPTPVITGALPSLAPVVAARWPAEIRAAHEAARAGVRRVVDDTRAIRRNLSRVPHAVRRRFPALLRRLGGRA